MAKTDTFQLSVVTPEKVAMECDARFVVLPAHDGEVGILAHRAPLVVKLGSGGLRVETAQDKRVLFVDGGFAEMAGNHLTVLTRVARRPDEIDREAAAADLVEARAMTVGDDVSFEARQDALQRARSQLQLAE